MCDNRQDILITLARTCSFSRCDFLVVLLKQHASQRMPGKANDKVDIYRLARLNRAVRQVSYYPSKEQARTARANCSGTL